MTNGVQGHYFIKFEDQSGFEKTEEEDRTNQVIWEKTFENNNGLIPVLNLCKSPEPLNKTRMKWILRFNRIDNLVLKVRRRGNLKVICKDLFLPLVVFAAGMKIRNISDVALIIFLILLSLPFDVLGFPIRLVTLIPSIIADRIENREQKKAKRNHPLYQYLIKQKEIDNKLLEIGTLFVTYGWKCKPQLLPGSQVKEIMSGTIYLNQLRHTVPSFERTCTITMLLHSIRIEDKNFVYYEDPSINQLSCSPEKVESVMKEKLRKNQNPKRKHSHTLNRQHYNINFELLTAEEEQKLTPKLKRVYDKIKAAKISYDLPSAFELSQSFTEKDLEKAYKKVALKVHPDKNPKANELATKLFQMVADIYQTLKNGPDYNIDRTQNLNPSDLFCSFFDNYNQRPFSFNF